MKIQPRTKQKKHKISSLAILKINDAVMRDAMRWNCSKSWIISTALAAFYGIDIITPYGSMKHHEAKKVVHFKKRA